MQTKPYNLQSPEDVAKEYGGNKQAIAKAAQMGMVDPTAAVLAGMFIDRMRNAVTQEQAPQQTVAQQVLAPPAPQMPAGLGAAQTGPRTGVDTLPVPESMYNEDSFAGGGIIAFDEGGKVPGFAYGQFVQDPSGFYSLPSESSIEDIIAAAQARRAIPLSEAEKAYQERLMKAPERAKEAKSEAFNQFLTETGLRMMQSRAPGLLAAAGESATAATPRLFAGSKEAKEIEEAGLKGMAEMGRTGRLEQLAGVTAGEQMYGKEQERISREEQGRLDRENRLAIANIPDKALQVAAQLQKDNPGLSYLDAISQAAQALSPKDTYNATRTAVSAAAKDANAEFLARAAYDAKLQADMKAAAAGDKAAQKRIDDIRNALQKRMFELYQVQGVDLSSGKMGSPSRADPLGIR